MDPSLNELRLIDSHAHINLLPESLEVLQPKFQACQIRYVLVPGFDLTSSIQAVTLAEHHHWIVPSAGIHPHDAFPDWSDSIATIKQLSQQKKIAAIGEIGLDGVRSKSQLPDQYKLLEEQLEIASEYQLPVIIHNREQDQMIGKILDSFPELIGILHCYSSEEELALAKIEQGWFISFSFNITYPKNAHLRNLLKKIPLRSLLLETDSPYLPPAEDRGKRNNSPANIPRLYQWVSECLSIPIQDVSEALWKNFIHLFSTYLEAHDGRP